MRRVLVTVAFASALIGGAGVVAGGGVAGASPHPNYPLGHASACRSGYAKRARWHWVTVDGLRVKRRYIECVWRPESASTGSSPGTSVSGPTVSPLLAPSAAVVDNTEYCPGIDTAQQECVEFAVEVAFPNAPIASASVDSVGTVTINWYSPSGETYTSVGWDHGYPVIAYVYGTVAIGISSFDVQYSGATYVDYSGDTVTIEPASTTFYLD
ncbi:MAG: hypothetical protein WCF24_02580 [Acidimicrobiales bacterium]